VSVSNMSENFLCFISSAVFTRKCVATRRVHVRVRALKDACVHTF